jgi:threonine dehydrogenase-like Zn-dependent dehydrogenase
VIEAAGAADSALLAARLARRGGRVVLTGIPGDDVAATLPVGLLVTKQLTVATVFGAPSSAWRAAVRAFNTGVLDPAPLITHELTLDDYGDALALLAERRPDVGKILLLP